MPARKSLFALAINNVLLVGLPGLCQAARRRTNSRLLRGGDMGLLEEPKYWAQATVNNACAGDSYLEFWPDRQYEKDPYWVWWENGITCPDGFDLVESGPDDKRNWKYCRSPTIPGDETVVITINEMGTISWPGVDSTADYDVTVPNYYDGNGEDYYLDADICFGWERCTGPDYSEDNASVYDGDYLVSGRPSWYSEWNGCDKVDPSGKNKPAPPESKPSKQPVPSSDAAGARSKPSEQPVVTGPSTNTNGTSNTTATTSSVAYSVGAGVVTAVMIMSTAV